MTTPAFTVLLPVHRAPLLLPLAIASVQAQTRADFELFIVSDGAPPETLAAAHSFASADPRITVFDYPKGERHGEAHRHTALQGARGRYVCHIADDDLWFPDHLQEMDRLLAAVDFGHMLHCFAAPEGDVHAVLADLADPSVAQRMLNERHNIFGPTAAGYRLEVYRRLPTGWSPAPADLWTDLFMWRKFLSVEGITVGTRFAISSLHFPASLRADWPLDRRHEEMTRFGALIAEPAGRDRLRQEAFSRAAREKTFAEAALAAINTAPPLAPPAD